MTSSPREDRCPPPRPRGRRRPAPGIDKSCTVLRTSTERPEAGCAKVMGFDATAIHEEMRLYDQDVEGFKYWHRMVKMPA